MAEMRLYQSADGSWIVFDGIAKQRFADEQSAQQTYGRLQTMSAIQEFEGLMGEIGTHVEAMLPLIDKASGIFAVNQVQALIDATPVGEVVKDSARTAQALGVFVALLTAFITFAETPLAGVGLTPTQIMRLR